MAEGRNRRLWDHTATIAAAALSAFREKPVEPAKLNPYESGSKKSTGIPLTAANIGILKTFVKPKARRGEGKKGKTSKAKTGAGRPAK